MNEASAFDRLAEQYDQWFDRHEQEYLLELDAVRMVLPGEGRGIEVGAGSGRFTGPLNIDLGIEPAEGMRRIASGRGVHLVDGEAESLPVDDHSCDFVLFVTTICYLDQPEAALKEAYRVLRSGGVVLIGMIDKNSRLGKAYSTEGNQNPFYAEAELTSVPEMQGMLARVGFVNSDCVQAVLPGDDDPEDKPPIRAGCGVGSFTVLRAQKAS